MNVEVLADAEAVAKHAAAFIAAAARDAVVARGRFAFAVSGGHTPWIMLKHLAGEKVPWEQCHLFQVDERIAPAGSDERNLTQLKGSLLSRVSLPANQIYAMPVESKDLPQAVCNYSNSLRWIAGAPPMLDLVHLGLGSDGHTASLVPNDPVLNVTDADVALTGAYQFRARMTLTYPTIDRARQIMWVVTGDEKVKMLSRLLKSDRSIPAGRVRAEQAVVFADRAASGQADS